MNDLFDWAPPPCIKAPLDGMHRKPDHETSIEAAASVNEIKTKLQQEIYDLLLERDMCDLELERLPQFESYSPSTVRKRRSELYQAARVEWTGEKRERAKVWRAVKVVTP